MGVQQYALMHGAACLIVNSGTSRPTAVFRQHAAPASGNGVFAAELHDCRR